uniref:Neprosin PEP catalytic domain-containing protein n=1 Tax=Kalanchoe fedtschenkoi TaxID=63787 RepID=A0A7N0VEF3_KALFE
MGLIRCHLQYAIVRTPSSKFYGGAGKISVWKPYVERDSEFSLAQMWVVSGLGDTTETLEVGWHRNEPRLFIFWTADSYKKTGCYNLNCDAFKHTSGYVTPGASLLDYSKVGGQLITLDIEIAKEERTKHWWLKINNEVVGYWPGNLFKWLDDGAQTVEWGGEITNDVRQTKSHTSTEMGSGLFPSDGIGKSAFAHTLKVIKTPNGPFKDPPKVNAYKTNVKCYDLVRNRYGFPYVGVNFFFGGKGRTQGGCL